jgi:hypothetical protein
MHVLLALVPVGPAEDVTIAHDGNATETGILRLCTFGNVGPVRQLGVSVDRVRGVLVRGGQGARK